MMLEFRLEEYVLYCRMYIKHGMEVMREKFHIPIVIPKHEIDAGLKGKPSCRCRSGNLWRCCNNQRSVLKSYFLMTGSQVRPMPNFLKILRSTSLSITVA